MLWLLPLLLLLLDNDIDHRPVPCHSIGSNIVWDRSTKALIQSQQSQTPCAVRHTAHTALAIDRKPAGNDIELLITFSAFKKRKTLSRNETQNKKKNKQPRRIRLENVDGNWCVALSGISNITGLIHNLSRENTKLFSQCNWILY